VIKRGNALPDADHVMRHVSYSKQMRDAEDNVVGFLPAAFEHREGEASLSMNWLEFYEGAHSANVVACKASLKAIRGGGKALFGVAEVGKTKMIAKHNDKPVRIVFAPSSDLPSHSAVHIAMPVPATAQESLAHEFYQEHYQS
jgi:hypothetical protein